MFRALPACSEGRTPVLSCVQTISSSSAPQGSGFNLLGLRSDLADGLAAIGFREPSPIQRAAIPELLLGRDLVGQAQTGTGKTAAFGLPLLHRLDPTSTRPQALVLTPTRELAMQVAEALSSYAAPMEGVKVLPVYGGADFRRQIDQLRRGTQIVVGTPGRVMDHIRQGTFQLDSLTTLVLDEADEMLRMGFIEDVEWVMDRLPEERQVVLFSATMPAPIRRLAQKYLRDPAEITITPDAGGRRRIRQRFLTVPPARKLNALERVLEAESGDGVIVFGRTKAITLQVAESLELRGHAVAVLNGDVPQAQRERTIERFRAGRVRVLVATDVAARGLDVERVTLVINYDVPTDGEAYVHRIGRTGRAGRRGDAILFLTPRERRFLTGLERAAGQPIEPMPVPDAAAINQGRLERLRERLSAALAEPAGSEEERALLAELLQRVAVERGCTPERLALAALELSLGGRPLLHREDAAPDMVPSAPRSAVEEGMERFRIEVGWRQRVRPGHIVGTIAGETGINGRSIGRIRIFDSHSTIDLPRGMDDDVLAGLRKVRLMNKEMRISRLPEESAETAAATRC